MADIPPWLNVQPAQFAQAAEAGARAGLQARIASEQNQRAIEEARLRRAAEDQMKQIRQFELQARINESAARMSSADLRNRMAQAQIQRQIKNDAMAAMAKQAQLDIARQALGMKQQESERRSTFATSPLKFETDTLGNTFTRDITGRPIYSPGQAKAPKLEDLDMKLRRVNMDKNATLKRLDEINKSIFKIEVADKDAEANKMPTSPPAYKRYLEMQRLNLNRDLDQHEAAANEIRQRMKSSPGMQPQIAPEDGQTQIESNMSLPPAANRFKYDEQQDDLVPASE